MYTSVSLLSECEVQVPEESRRGRWTLELELQVVMNYLTWVLGTQLRSSVKAVLLLVPGSSLQSLSVPSQSKEKPDS